MVKHEERVYEGGWGNPSWVRSACVLQCGAKMVGERDGDSSSSHLRGRDLRFLGASIGARASHNALHLTHTAPISQRKNEVCSHPQGPAARESEPPRFKPGSAGPQALLPPLSLRNEAPPSLTCLTQVDENTGGTIVTSTKHHKHQAPKSKFKVEENSESL